MIDSLDKVSESDLNADKGGGCASQERLQGRLLGRGFLLQAAARSLAAHVATALGYGMCAEENGLVVTPRGNQSMDSARHVLLSSSPGMAGFGVSLAAPAIFTLNLTCCILTLGW